MMFLKLKWCFWNSSLIYETLPFSMSPDSNPLLPNTRYTSSATRESLALAMDQVMCSGCIWQVSWTFFYELIINLVIYDKWTLNWPKCLKMSSNLNLSQAAQEAEREVERRAKENQERLSRIFSSNNLEAEMASRKNNSAEEPPSKIQGQIQCLTVLLWSVWLSHFLDQCCKQQEEKFSRWPAASEHFKSEWKAFQHLS